MGFLGLLLGFGSSLIDMGSDLLTGLQLYNSSIFGMYYGTFDDIEEENNKIWGIMTIFFIFLPGFVVGFPTMVWKIWERKWWDAFAFLVGSIFFPIIIIGFELWTIIMTCLKKEVSQGYQTWITLFSAAEASLEATPQLMLQIFTLFNGYHSSLIQIFTICSSFYAIARSVILNDIETKLFIKREDSLSYCQSLKEIWKKIPLYFPNIIFRTGSLVITMVYLRYYAIIPILILLFELGWISWIRYRKWSEMSDALKYAFQLMMYNLGVLCFYVIGQWNLSEEEEDIKNFTIRSTLVTFFHHITVMVIIMIIGFVQPDFFIPAVVFTPAKGWFYPLIGSVIGMGVFSLIVTLCYVYWKKL